MESLSKDLANLRDTTANLADRIDQALKAYRNLKDQLEQAKKDADDKNRQLEDGIRKLNADVAATEAQANDAEREAQEYDQEVS